MSPGEIPVVRRLQGVAERHPVAAVALPLFLMFAATLWRGYVQIHEAMYFVGAHQLVDPGLLAHDLSWSRMPPSTFLYNHLIAPFWNPVGDLGVALGGRLLFWALTAWSLAILARLARFPAWAVFVGVGLWLAAGQSVAWCGRPMEGFQPKALAYPLFYFSLAFAMRDRAAWAGVFAGAATAFHIVVGGWGMFAVLAAMLLARAAWRALLVFALGAAPFVVPLVVAFARHNSGGSPAEQAVMDRIFVTFAGPHCCDVSDFMNLDRAIQAALVLALAPVLLYLRSSERPARMLAHFVTALVALYAAGLGAHVLQLYGFLKLMPYQLADAIPLLFLFVAGLSAVAPAERAWTRRVAWAALLAGAWVLYRAEPWKEDQVAGARRFALWDERPDRALHYGNVPIPPELYRWIREKTPRDAIFVTPQLEEFWVCAERAQVASMRQYPFDRGIIEWQERLVALNGGRPFKERGFEIAHELYEHEGLLTVAQLIAMRERWGATHYLTLSERTDLRPHEVLGSSLYHVYALAGLTP